MTNQAHTDIPQSLSDLRALAQSHDHTQPMELCTLLIGVLQGLKEEGNEITPYAEMLTEALLVSAAVSGFCGFALDPAMKGAITAMMTADQDFLSNIVDAQKLLDSASRSLGYILNMIRN